MIEAEYGSAAYTHKQMAALEQRGQYPAVYPHPAITDTQVAHARLNKQGHRPLGRTQSAPLPLGHPMLNTSPTSPTHHQMSTHNLLRQVRARLRTLFKINKVPHFFN